MRTLIDAYTRHQSAFIAWCGARSIDPLQAAGADAAAFLLGVVKPSTARGTVGQICSALDLWFVEQGCDLPPTRSQQVRKIRRQFGYSPRPIPLADAEVRQMMRVCPATRIGLRDRAVIALIARERMRRGAVVSLVVEDPRASCVPEVPVWLRAAGIQSGPVFRAVTRGGRVSGDALADESVWRIIKERARQAGIDPAFCNTESLRIIGGGVR
jgi:site-specific recombinase XerD